MKLIFKIIVALLLVYIVVAFIAPADAKVERKIVIAVTPEVLAPFLVDQKVAHTTWSPWAEKDRNMKVQFAGNPSQVGHKMEWVSDNKAVGTGTMELMRLSADSIVYALSFEGMGSSPIYYIAKPVAGGLEITMGLSMHAPFIFRPMMMLGDPEKEIAPDFEHGLANLKKVAEQAQADAKFAYQVNEIEWPETFFVGTKYEIVKLADLGAYFAKNLPEVGNALIKQDIKPQAAPMAIYKWFDEKKGETELAAVSKVGKGDNLKGYTLHAFNSCKVLHVAYYGGYNDLGRAHGAIDHYMQAKGYTQNVAMEEYVTDPSSEPDTSKWLTNIFYLIK